MDHYRQATLELLEKAIKDLSTILLQVERVERSAFVEVDTRNVLKIIKTTTKTLLEHTLRPFQAVLLAQKQREEMWEVLRAMLRRDEGLRLTPYQDSEGYWTVGYGTRLNRIDRQEAEFLLEHRLRGAIAQAVMLPHYEKLNEARQFAIINLVYNIGYTSAMAFKRMWAAAGREDWENMAVELLDSKYARQVGARAQRLAEILRTGELPGEVGS